MVIKTPNILPGEPGWEERKITKKSVQIKEKVSKKRTPEQVGNIVLGSKMLRFGLPLKNYKGETKYYIWKFKIKIGEVTVDKNDKISLEFFKFKRIGNYRDLINDVDFQKKWVERENELLESQKDCYICGKKISKGAKPNIYHYNMFKKKSELLENSENVAEEVVSGKLTAFDGWEKFNDILKEGNRNYMSLKDTALICANCEKNRDIHYKVKNFASSVCF